MAKFENRHQYIGASDFPVVMEKSKWKKRIQLVLEKAQVIAVENVENSAMARGTRLEPKVIEEFEKRTGLKVVNFQKEVAREKTDTCIKLLAHLDGEILSEKAVMEAKTTNINNKWVEIPEYYIPQLELQMFLNKCKKAYISVGYVNSDDDEDICDFDYFFYEKQMTNKEIIKICEEFTKDVEQYKQLGVINSGKIKDFEIDSKMIERYEELEEKIKEIKKQLKPFEDEKKLIESRFKQAIGNDYGLQNDLYRITLSNRITSPSVGYKVSRSGLKIEYRK